MTSPAKPEHAEGDSGDADETGNAAYVLSLLDSMSIASHNDEAGRRLLQRKMETTPSSRRLPCPVSLRCRGSLSSSARGVVSSPTEMPTPTESAPSTSPLSGDVGSQAVAGPPSWRSGAEASRLCNVFLYVDGLLVQGSVRWQVMKDVGIEELQRGLALAPQCPHLVRFRAAPHIYPKLSTTAKWSPPVLHPTAKVKPQALPRRHRSVERDPLGDEAGERIHRMRLRGALPRDPSVAHGGEADSRAENGFVLGDDDLEKIVALLLWMAQNFQSDIHIDDIHHAALDVIIKHSEAATGGAAALLHTASVANLSELIDIMMLHKDGSPKDANATLEFMRRAAQIREELSPTASDNATKRVELDANDVSKCYQRFGRVLLTHDLLPHQKQRYNFKDDTYLSRSQRFFIDDMLRKYLGDKRVARFIWQHGIPSIADRPLVFRRRVNSKALALCMLQSGLDECLRWYSCLANHIVVHQTQEGFDAQLSASSLDEQERQRQQTRREALQKARDALRLGAALAKQRDDKKRSYTDMDNAEQKVLEDYESGRTKKAKQGLTTPKMKPFRCKLQDFGNPD